MQLGNIREHEDRVNSLDFASPSPCMEAHCAATDCLGVTLLVAADVSECCFFRLAESQRVLFCPSDGIVRYCTTPTQRIRAMRRRGEAQAEWTLRPC